MSARFATVLEVAVASSLGELGRGAGKETVPRVCGAFSDVGIAVNHLKVRQSPKRQ